MSMPSIAMTGSPPGERLLRSILTSFAQRAAFALGLVFGVALLGALAFTTRTDVRVLWFDELGHLAIGMQRTQTQERLDQVARELAETKHLLEVEQAPRVAVARDGGVGEVKRFEEAARAAEQRARDAERASERAQKTIAEHVTSITSLKRQNADQEGRLQGQRSLQAQFDALTASVALKDLEIGRLKEQLRTFPRMNEYRAAVAGEQAYLPLRERPERGSRFLKKIPGNAGGVYSNCKVVVVEDAVFIEASYQGVTGWVSGFYLAPGR